MMTMMTRRILLLFVFIAFSGAISAQENDMGLWMSFSGEKKLSDKIRFENEISIRLENNASDISKLLIEPSLEYRITKEFRASITYRYSQIAENDDNYWYSNHRFSAGLRYKIEIKRLSIRWQSKYQYSVNKDFDEYQMLESKTHLRNKLTFGYNIKKSPISPYLFGEVYTPFDYGNARQFEFDTYRLQLGSKYKINKDLSVKAFFMYEKEYRNSGWRNNYLGGINLSFDF